MARIDNASEEPRISSFVRPVITLGCVFVTSSRARHSASSNAPQVRYYHSTGEHLCNRDPGVWPWLSHTAGWRSVVEGLGIGTAAVCRFRRFLC